MEASHQAIACDLSKPRDLKMVHVPRRGAGSGCQPRSRCTRVCQLWRSGLWSPGWHLFHHSLSPARTGCDKSMEFGLRQSGFYLLALQPLAKRLVILSFGLHIRRTGPVPSRGLNGRRRPIVETLAGCSLCTHRETEAQHSVWP